MKTSMKQLHEQSTATHGVGLDHLESSDKIVLGTPMPSDHVSKERLLHRIYDHCLHESGQTNNPESDVSMANSLGIPEEFATNLESLYIYVDELNKKVECLEDELQRQEPTPFGSFTAYLGTMRNALHGCL